MTTLGDLETATPEGSGDHAHDASLAPDGYGHDMAVPSTVVCVDCGGTCHLISYEPEEGFAAGDVVAFRCEDCLDRWDIELTDDDVDPSPGPD